MKNLFRFSGVVVCIFILLNIQSCKKDQDTIPAGPVLLSVSNSSVTLNDEVVVTGKGFSTIDADNVVNLDDQQVEVFNSSATQLSIKIRENITIGAKKLTLYVSSKKADASLDMKVYGWKKVTDHPSGGFFDIASFSIDNNIYFCNAIASGNSSHIRELWKYNLTDNSWTRLKDFPGSDRYSVACFALSGKGYMGLGDVTSPGSPNEFWEYDPALDKWTQVADFPGVKRVSNCNFILNGKAYVGGGFTWGAPGTDLSDFYSYTPATNTWYRVADIPEKVSDCAAFVVNNKAFVAGGTNSNGVVASTYQYDDITNTWTAKTDFPSPNSENLRGFGINSTGYCGLGVPLGNEHGTNALWSYNPDLNTWTPIAPFPGAQRRSYLIGTVGKYAYYGMGSESNDFSDIWIYAPKDYTP